MNTVWIVRDRKYWSVLEVCSSKEAAKSYIKEHGMENNWLYQEKMVRKESPADVKTVY